MLVILLMVVLVCAVYEPVRHHGFVNYDDDVYVTANRQVREGLGRKGLAYAFMYRGDYPRPLTYLSHMLDCTLYGLDPGGHHLSSLILHLAGSILLFLVLRRMSRDAFWSAAFAAFLFGVHPLNVESVAWVSERKGLLSGVFWMLTILAYVQYAERPGLLRFLPVPFLFCLGLLSKPSVAALPLVLLLLDYWPLGRVAGHEPAGGTRFKAFPFSRLVLEKIPLLLPAAIFGILVFVSEHATGTLPGLEVFPVKARTANALVSFWTYVGDTVWPVGLAPFYPYPRGASFWGAFAAFAALCAATALAVGSWRSRPYLFVGWLWFVVTLFPVAGLFQVGSHAMADRYFYLPGIGLFIMASWGLGDLAGRVRGRGRAVGVAVAGSVVLLLGCVSRAQVRTWQNSKTLWEHALKVTERNYLACNNLGLVLFREGKIPQAIALYREAIGMNPGFSQAHNNLGVALAVRGDGREAERSFRRALALDPRNSKALANLGLAFLRAGRSREAEEAFREVLKGRSGDERAHYNLGLALMARGKKHEAMREFSRALELHPRYAEAHNNLGVVLSQQRRFQEAAGHFRAALKILPDYPEARRNLEVVRTALRAAQRTGEHREKAP